MAEISIYLIYDWDNNENKWWQFEWECQLMTKFKKKKERKKDKNMVIMIIILIMIIKNNNNN